jgi:hypothetical protein
MIGKNVSWVDKEAMHFFMSPKLARDLRFADTKSGQTYQCAVWKG